MGGMEENPYEAPVGSTLSTGVKLLPRPLAHFLTTLSFVAAALFVFMAVACFCDATWTVWQPPWELGTEGEPLMIALLASVAGLALSLVTAWAAMRKRKSIVAAALVADAAFLVLLASL